MALRDPFFAKTIPALARQERANERTRAAWERKQAGGGKQARGGGGGG
jgi:hypothetical protein